MVAPGLKARYIDVYLPSKEAKREWEEEAMALGMPLSKFVFEAVESYRASKKEAPRFEIVRELAEAKEEAQKLRNDVKMKSLLLEKLEAEIYKTRYAEFKDVEIGEGTRRHDQALIKILRGGKALEGYMILEKLGIDPVDIEAIKLVNNQLQSLQSFGLVQETTLGWRWVE